MDRSQEKAVEIAGQILAECFTKSPSLLEKWEGGDNLEAFLRKVAGNRLRSWWSSFEKLRTEVTDETRAFERAASPSVSEDLEELEAARQALRVGVAAAMERIPEGLVFMRLKGLHGVDQRTISRCWGHHEAQTSRRIKEAMELIRKTASDFAKASGYGLSIDLLHRALQHDPSILLGEPVPLPMKDHYELLADIAGGEADDETKQTAVQLMCADPAMLAFFADALNRKSESDAMVVRDPGLSGVSARLADCVQRSLEILKPAEASSLITRAMVDCFADLLAGAHADGGTLWMLCPGKAALEAVMNPLEPEIVGKRQPLVSGIVSLVLATGETACVAGVPAHLSHSPAIDIALGKTTHSMIAVPVSLAGTIRGVLTVVRLTEGQSLGERETRMFQSYAEILASLMVQNLTTKILV
jgi:DNA-directed RNA polymerase specialized sigma24 family protein